MKANRCAGSDTSDRAKVSRGHRPGRFSQISLAPREWCNPKGPSHYGPLTDLVVTGQLNLSGDDGMRLADWWSIALALQRGNRGEGEDDMWERLVALNRSSSVF